MNQIAPLRMRRMVAAMPPLTHEVERFPDMDKSWGLSFMINTEEAPSGRSAGSLAWRTLTAGSIWRRALAASMRPRCCLSPTPRRCRYFWRSNPNCIATRSNITPSAIVSPTLGDQRCHGLFIAQGTQIARTLPDRRACRIIPQDQGSSANRPPAKTVERIIALRLQRLNTTHAASAAIMGTSSTEALSVPFYLLFGIVNYHIV